MEEQKLQINKSAKLTEILFAYFLHEKIYRNEKLIVGDEFGKFPDIRNEQGTIGIEVVQAEEANDFASNIIWKKYEKFKGDARKLKAYIRTKLSNFEVKLFINQNKVEAWTTNLCGHSSYYSKHIFETVMTKKLEKLNSGNYSSINGEIDLAILSIFRAKPDRVIAQIQNKYKQLCENYEHHFNKVFVLFTDALFEIDENSVTKFFISESELETLKQEFKKLAKTSK